MSNETKAEHVGNAQPSQQGALDKVAQAAVGKLIGELPSTTQITKIVVMVQFGSEYASQQASVKATPDSIDMHVIRLADAVRGNFFSQLAGTHRCLVEVTAVW